MQALLPQVEAVDVHVQVDPPRQGLFLLDSQFGLEMKCERKLILKWRINPAVAKDSLFDVSVTILFLRSKKSRSCLMHFYS